MTIAQLSVEVTNAFIEGQRASVGPFTSTGNHLLLDGIPIAYRDAQGEIFRVDPRIAQMQKKQKKQIKEAVYLDVFMVLFATLACVGGFFYVLFAQFGGY